MKGLKPFLALVLALLISPIFGLWAQVTLANDDIPKLVKSGLSEDFILNLIDHQGSKLSSDVSRLIELKINGVSERIIAAVARKTPPPEPLTSYGLVQLAKAQFSEGFLLDLVNQRPGQIATDSARLVELKRAGVSEAVISTLVKKRPPAEPMTADAVLQLVKAGFSEGFIIDLLNRQPVKFSGDAGRIVDLKQAGVSERILAATVAKGLSRELPSGTEITIRLIDSIDSEKNNAGDEFRASIDEPITLGDDVIAPKGSDAKVILVTEKESGKLTGKTELTVQLLSFSFAGRAVPVNTTSVTQGSGSRGARTAKTAAAVGAVGAIIGAIAGGGKGAAIGAGAGAAAGAGSQVFMKGQRVRIPSETVLTFTTQEAVKLP
ncbi:MAG TPA: hypothetical protein VKW78_04750 [Terriglobales bacterium]|nr:hypothetical protein [Terriglobales bacterium]